MYLKKVDLVWMQSWMYYVLCTLIMYLMHNLRENENILSKIISSKASLTFRKLERRFLSIYIS